MSGVNSSINQLVGTFSGINTTSNSNLNLDSIISIDTENNRIGINTIDPSYDIHVVSPGIISTPNIDISGNLTGVIDLSNNNIDQTLYNLSIVRFILPDNSNGLQPGQLYREDNFVKIK
jgi:hypothetical protein